MTNSTPKTSNRKTLDQQIWWCELAVIGGEVTSGVTVTVANGRFKAIAANTEPTPDCTQLGGLTVPGFANAHSHAFHRALRSRVQAERGSFWTWREVMYTAAARLEPDSYHRLARAVFAEMAMAGMSVVGEFHYLHHQTSGAAYDDANAMGNALLQAATDAGIRITLLDTLYLHGGLNESGYVPLAGTQDRFTDHTGDDWVDRVDALRTTDNQRIGAAIHSVRAVDPRSMAAVVDWVTDRRAPLHAHVSEQLAENEQCLAAHDRTPVELLHSIGALETNFTAVHATHLTATDIEHLGSCAATVCMCPTTERDLGDGIGPTPELAHAGASISLGSDSHAVIDQMIEARAVELDERLRSQNRGTHSASELLDMATTIGHSSLGWTDAGDILVGNRADLTTVSLRTERTAGASPHTAIEALVFASTASDITSVVIDGKQIVHDGQHRSIDVAAELSESIEELFT